MGDFIDWFNRSHAFGLGYITPEHADTVMISAFCSEENNPGKGF
jgi:hypothetical protein